MMTSRLERPAATIAFCGAMSIAVRSVVLFAVTYGPCKTVPEPCYHFVGFRSLADQRLANAMRVFGPPDFLHRRWDMRAQREIAPGDVVIFAQGEADQHPSRYNGDDEAYGQADRAEPSRCIRS